MSKQLNAIPDRTETTLLPGCGVPSCRGTSGPEALGSAGLEACASCVKRLADDLTRLPGLYRACEVALVPPVRGLTEKVRGGHRSGGVSLDGAALTARSTMMTTLSSWAGFIADTHRLPVRPVREVSTLAGFVLARLAWLSTQPVIRDAAEEFREVVRCAENAMDPSAGRLDLGPCDRPDCSARVYADIGSGAGVGCDRGHRRPPSEWLLLRRRRDTKRHGQDNDTDTVSRSTR